MRYSLAIAALVGSSLAAPSYGAPSKNVEIVEHVEVVTVVKTVYVTEGTPEATQPSYDAAPAVTTTYVQEPEPTPEYVAKPAPTSAPVYEAPAPEPTYEAPAAPASGYQGVVDTWRSKMGLKPLKNSAKLQGNALDCVKSSPGKMSHKLNPGSYGQVLAPGGPDDFEHVFVGGWLCEMPSIAGLGEETCRKQSVGWDYAGQTGHAEILTAPNYSEIGCANYDGIWSCDLA